MPLNPERQSIRMLMADVDGTWVMPEKDLTEPARQVRSRLQVAGLK